MRRNLEMTAGLDRCGGGDDGARAYLGRNEAHDVVYAACRTAGDTGKSLAEVLAGVPEVAAHWTEKRSAGSPAHRITWARRPRWSIACSRIAVSTLTRPETGMGQAQLGLVRYPKFPYNPALRPSGDAHSLRTAYAWRGGLPIRRFPACGITKSVSSSIRTERAGARHGRALQGHGRARNGKVHRLEDWGRRQLSYPLAKVHKAHYVLMNIECDNETISELEHSFRFNDAVLRHLTVKMTKAVVDPPR